MLDRRKEWFIWGEGIEDSVDKFSMSEKKREGKVYTEIIWTIMFCFIENKTLTMSYDKRGKNNNKIGNIIKKGK